MAETSSSDDSIGGRLDRWLSVGASVIAPVTALTTLMFYFGYVSSRTEYEYFGLDVDTIGLSTQDYVMRSGQALLTPLLGLALAGAGIAAGHAVIRRRTAAAVASGDTGPIARAFRASLVIGLVLLCAGVVLLVIYGYLRDWPYYAMVTPLIVGTGAALTAYSRQLLIRIDGHDAHTAASHRTANVLLYLLALASVFWMTATFAQWSGRGLARYQAQHLDRLPSVILDTREHLFLHDPVVKEATLPASAEQTFHYRYRHLRLLIQGPNRMFLVPDRWSASNSTLVVTVDDSTRLEFQFENDPP